MIILKKSINLDFLKILGLILVLMLMQSCSAYKKSTNLEQAAQVEQNGFVKVTLTNGDEYIYESIEFSGDTYYGLKTVNGEKIKTLLLKDEVLKVERRNKSGFGVLGLAIVLGSVIMAVLMF
jgi:hypothetical protein